MNNIDKAIRTADWICRNQYESMTDWQADPYKDFDMNEDMNYGRFVRNYSLTEKKIVHLSTNWITGMTIYGLLMLYDHNGDKKYLDGSIQASFYLKALQNTMSGNPEYLGAFNERIPANRWGSVRDGLSAAWSFLRLYRTTGEKEFLNRAELFASWHMNYALRGDYPFSKYMFSEKANKVFLASCQGGSSLFYYDLFKLTDKNKYRDCAVKIIDFYINNFLNADGSIAIIYDPETGYKGDKKDSPAWSDMHKFNDDFSALAVLSVYELTGEEKYLNAVVNYLNWVVSSQHDSGGFGLYSLTVSSCIAALNCMNLFIITGNAKFKDAGYRALHHLEESVVTAPDDPVIHGAILGLDVAKVAENNDMISLRVTMYAIYTFLLYGLYEEFISKNIKDEIPDQLIDNPMFIGIKLSS